MRIFCFSSIHQLPPDQNICDVVPYDINAHERKSEGFYRQNTIENESNYKKFLNNCQLTEISIGYKRRNLIKVYSMLIYRSDTQIISIPMVRGAVQFKPLPNKAYDFIIATSRIFPEFNFDIRINICCIRNTRHRTAITKDEEIIYTNYAKQINRLCKYNSCLQEKAFSMQPPMKLPNPSTEKNYKQKIRDIQDILNLLCDPKNGSFKNVKPNSRIDQHLELFFGKRDSWNAFGLFKSTVNRQAEKHRGVRFIKLEKCDAKHLEVIEPGKVKRIYCKDMVDIIDSEKRLCKFFKNKDFTYLVELSLISCRFTEIAHEFVQWLPTSLSLLDLDHNDITFISKEISKLKNLLSLSLQSNKNLSDGGIPWKFLPPSIKLLNLKYTSILNIPTEIKSLTQLEMLRACSDKLEYVSWENISETIVELKVQGNGKLNKFDLQNKNKLLILDIIYAGLKEINCSKLPTSLERLTLCDNELTHFDCRGGLSNLQYLYLRNNGLKSIAWENLPASLRYLFLEHNELTAIGKIKHLIQLRTFEVPFNQIRKIPNEICHLQKLANGIFNHNQLSSLPIGFENLSSMHALNLAYNKFNYQDSDLNKTLWQQIPRTTETLSLSYNSLQRIPCMLKEINIKHLYVYDCMLGDICPYIATQKAKTLKHISVAKNPKMEKLPFIPFPENKHDRQLTVTSDSIEITTKGRKKLKYTFNAACGNEESNTVCCKCCANCGLQTETKRIQQMMLMDFKINKWETSEWKLYQPGEWKTYVVTNLCQNCINRLKQDFNDSRYTKTVKRKASAFVFPQEAIPRPFGSTFNMDAFDGTSEHLPLTFTDMNWSSENFSYGNDERYYHPHYQGFNQNYSFPYPSYGNSYDTYSSEYPGHGPIISYTTVDPCSSQATRYVICDQQPPVEVIDSAQPYLTFPFANSDAPSLNNMTTAIPPWHSHTLSEAVQACDNYLSEDQTISSGNEIISDRIYHA